MKNKLFIKNLSEGTTEDKIKNFLSSARNPRKIRILSNNKFMKTEVFALVEMDSVEDVQEIIKTLDGKDFEGKTISISKANPIVINQK